MKNLILAIFIVAAASATHAQEPASAAKADAKTQFGRVLYFYKKDSGNPCDNIPIASRSKAYYLGDSACKNDQVYRISVDRGKIGDVIIVGADNPKGSSSCPTDDWTFQLEVVDEKPWGEEYVVLSDLKSVKNGTKIGSLLKMKSNKYDHGSIGGKLSCAQTIPAS